MKKYLSLLTLALPLIFSTNSAIAAAGSPGTDTQTQAFLEVLEKGGGTPMERLSANKARNVLTGAQQGVTLPKADVTHKTIIADGHKVDLVIVKPKGAQEKLPAFMFFHGGGWVIGDFPTHERLIRDLVVRSGTAAIYVDYSRSPEAKYPTAINQAYAATKWVADNGLEIGVDGSQLAVAGNSAGGNIAAVVSLKAKSAGVPKLKFQLLLWPVTDASFTNSSYQAFAEGHFLTKNMMEWFWDSYTTDLRERNEIYASPLRATIEQLKDLPPALIQTAEKDVLRDEGEAYGRKLNLAGVKVTTTRYNGMIHDYGLLNALSKNPTVETALDQAAGALKKHLK
ncbi:alpha/beta hydrolase [Pseudoalteromonas denitrificans]|uniref:Acetyl esterase/lipase n=1 Tax=Pseudoalteromonas denitrificans DSM 6059 TaxID=1123010 RepID=A0A1I1RCJ4_9GAMM|nr:alpha/beta hydrolase [Pseudoalteromonas denitrificans]SFD32015.1 Acetyl esterase/lipase [Pseudoalteromonas denitrificans DSM 6059]